ncbi:MAG: LamG-like jellyroll fold domain-containing protein [Planctomycetota bacterium]|nr:LamG-like jellyroll fold domain-containing protein [Planctomycetota bacterium]
MALTIRAGLCALLLTVAHFSTPAPAQQPPQLLGNLARHAIAVWDFSDPSAALLRDLSGHGHDGNLMGATWVRGPWGSALRFRRAQRNYVSVPDSAALHVQPPYSFGVWFRTTSSQNNAVYLLKNGGTFTGCGLYYYGDSMSMYVDAKGVDDKLYHNGNSAQHMPNGEWHHAVASVGAGKQTLYLDGKVFTQRAIPADLRVSYAGTRGLQLGAWLGNGHFEGLMADAFLLKTALDGDQVQDLFQRGDQRFNAPHAIATVTDPPTLDGRLTDPCWQQATALEPLLQTNYDTIPAADDTRIQLCRDQHYLYLAAHTTLAPSSTTAPPNRPRDDSRITSDDRLEIFLTGRSDRYYHLVLSATNSLLDQEILYQLERAGPNAGRFTQFSRLVDWNCAGVQTAVHTGGATRTFELALPLAEFGEEHRTHWQFNVARGLPTLPVTSYSPLAGSLHQPPRFSQLTQRANELLIVRKPKAYTSLDVTPQASRNVSLAVDQTPLVFANNYLRRGTYTSLPHPADAADRINLFASPGEFEPASVSVRAQAAPLSQVHLALAGNLVRPDGGHLDVRHVTFRVAELWRRQMNSRTHMYMERFLQKARPLDIPRHTTRRFWITVEVPEDTPAGIYQTTLQVSANQTTIASLPFRVEVLPIKLTRAAGMGYFMYLPTWGVPPELRSPAHLKRIFVDMRQHGMTTATLYPYGLPFDAVMGALRDSALMRTDVPAIWLGADAVGPEQWKSVLDQGQASQWPELALYLQDEPGNQERIDNAKRLFRILDQFRQDHPEYRDVRATTAIGTTGIEALGAAYDIWIAGAGFGQEMATRADKMGKLLWSYDCNLAPVDAENARYYFGWYCWKAGIKGSALWAYSDPGTTRGDGWQRALKNLSGTELHYAFVCPTAEDMIPTIGWEAVREGIDDHRYMATLRQAIVHARQAGKVKPAATAQAVLQAVTDEIDLAGYRAGILGGEASPHRLGSHYDRSSPQPDLPKAGYNRWRRRLADAIIALHQAE